MSELRERAVAVLAACGVKPDVTDDDVEEETNALVLARSGYRGLSRHLLAAPTIPEVGYPYTDPDWLVNERDRRFQHEAPENDEFRALDRRLRHIEVLSRYPKVEWRLGYDG